jgi:hypothetical protein
LPPGNQVREIGKAKRRNGRKQRTDWYNFAPPEKVAEGVFTIGNYAWIFLSDKHNPLIFLVNIVLVTFSQNFLEGHNIWCQDGRRSPISRGNAFFQKGSFFFKNDYF